HVNPHPATPDRRDPTSHQIPAAEEPFSSAKLVKLREASRSFKSFADVFPWEGPAYYGLVDLRLLMSGKLWPTTIAPPQFAGILSSCPRLCTLYCDIEVKEIETSAQRGTGPASVQPAELETLNIRRMNHDQHKDFLPLISPGVRPLSLSIQVATPRPTENLFSTTVLDFFNRSNVTALYIRGSIGQPSLPLKRLLADSPSDTRIIGFEKFELDQGITGPMGSEQSYLTQLDCLNMTGCIFHIQALRELVGVCAMRVVKLVTHECLVDDENRVTNRTLNKLATMFSMVKYITWPTPVEEWNSWGVAESEWKIV
ncbi:hypothetical protein FRC11_002076, partial [Ceratobasidium sp. 423]